MSTVPAPEGVTEVSPVAAAPGVAEEAAAEEVVSEEAAPEEAAAEPEIIEAEAEPAAEPELIETEPEAEPLDDELPEPVPEGAEGFSWLLIDFAQRVPDVHHVLAVSADGLLMGMSAELGRTQGDTVAAIVAGLTSLVRGASSHLGGGAVRQAIVEMDELFLLTMSVSDGAVLAVVADAGCDVGLVGYEMAMLASRAEAVLTPALIEEARALLPVDDAGVRVRPPGGSS